MTPEVRALESRPTVPAGPSSARQPPLANSTRATPRKRKRFYDPAAVPRMGLPSFSVGQYVNHQAGSRLDAYRYSRLRVGYGKAMKAHFVAGGQNRTTDSRYGC